MPNPKTNAADAAPVAGPVDVTQGNAWDPFLAALDRVSTAMLTQASIAFHAAVNVLTTFPPTNAVNQEARTWYWLPPTRELRKSKETGAYRELTTPDMGGVVLAPNGTTKIVEITSTGKFFIGVSYLEYASNEDRKTGTKRNKADFLADVIRAKLAILSEGSFAGAYQAMAEKMGIEPPQEGSPSDPTVIKPNWRKAATASGLKYFKPTAVVAIRKAAEDIPEIPFTVNAVRFQGPLPVDETEIPRLPYTCPKAFLIPKGKEAPEGCPKTPVVQMGRKALEAGTMNPPHCNVHNLDFILNTTKLRATLDKNRATMAPYDESIETVAEGPSVGGPVDETPRKRGGQRGVKKANTATARLLKKNTPAA